MMPEKMMPESNKQSSSRIKAKLTLSMQCLYNQVKDCKMQRNANILGRRTRIPNNIYIG